MRRIHNGVLVPADDDAIVVAVDHTHTLSNEAHQR